MTFRQQCAVAAMREILRAAATKGVDGGPAEIASAAFKMADAMVAASGDNVHTCGAAPSRTAVRP